MTLAVGTQGSLDAPIKNLVDYYNLFSTSLNVKLSEDQVLHYNALPASCANSDLCQNKYFPSMVINALKLKTLP